MVRQPAIPEYVNRLGVEPDRLRKIADRLVMKAFFEVGPAAIAVNKGHGRCTELFVRGRVQEGDRGIVMLGLHFTHCSPE